MSTRLINRIHEINKPLTETEQRLVNILIKNKDAALFESVNALAEMAGTHGSALVRLARKLGFSGFPEMRQFLRQDFNEKPKTEDLIRKRLSESADSSILNHLIEGEIEALKNLQNYIQQQQLNAVADRLLRADRVLIFAEGTAESLARHAEHRLRRAGQLTIKLSPDVRSVSEGTTLMRPQDMLIGFALRESPMLLKVLFDQAQKIGVTTVLISDLSGLIHKPSPDYVLAASRGSDAESGTLTVPMTILNALILTVASRGAPETLAHYESYTQTRDTIL